MVVYPLKTRLDDGLDEEGNFTSEKKDTDETEFETWLGEPCCLDKVRIYSGFCNGDSIERVCVESRRSQNEVTKQ